MSLYQKLINDLFANKGKEVVKNEELFETINDLDFSQFEEEINSKIGDFKKNIPLFELLFKDALQKSDLQTDSISGDLTGKEKQMFLDMVMEFIRQFEELELTSKVDSPNDDN